MAKKRQSFSIPRKPLGKPHFRRQAWPAEREVVSMTVVADDTDLTQETYSSDSPPVIEGPTNIDFVCGSCSALLAKGAYGDELDGVSLECPACEKLNVVPASWEPKV